MTASKIVIEAEGRTLEIITDLIEYQSISEPDPGWRYTDRAGHVHTPAVERTAGDGGDPKIVGYPTLVWTTEDHECFDLCEDDGCPAWWECPQCGEHIRPGSRAGRPGVMRGMTTYEIDGEPVSPTAARDFVTGWQRELNARFGHDPARVADSNLRLNAIKEGIKGADDHRS